MANKGIGQSKAAICFGRPRDFALHGVGHVKNVLDIIFLTNAVLAQLAILLHAPSPHACDECAAFLGGRGGAMVGFAMLHESRQLTRVSGASRINRPGKLRKRCVGTAFLASGNCL